MSLAQMRSQTTPAAAKTPVTNTTFGAVLEIATAREVDGSLELTGKTLTGSKYIKAEQPVTVRFRGDGSRALTNFTKGNGKSALTDPAKSAGTFVMLESCYVVNDEEHEGRPVLNARWLNTLANVRNADHENRSLVEGVLATAPRLLFANPSVAPGEPKSITLPVNASAIRGRGEDGRWREFPREWAVTKLNALTPTTKVQVVIDTLEPSVSEKVDSMDALKGALRSQLARGTKALSMLRISDGSEIATRLIYVPFKRDGKDYLPDVEKALDDLFKFNVFQNIPNETLAKAVDSGSVIAEVIPGYRMTYAGDSTKDDNAAFKLVNDVRTDKAGRYEVLFGTDPSKWASVILSGIARTQEIDGFSPILAITHEPGFKAPDEFETLHVTPALQAAADEEPEPAPDSEPDEGDQAPRP